MYPQCLPKYKFNYFVHINRQKISLSLYFHIFSPHHIYHLSYAFECLSEWFWCHFSFSNQKRSRNRNPGERSPEVWSLELIRTDKTSKIQPKKKRSKLFECVCVFVCVRGCVLLSVTIVTSCFVVAWLRECVFTLNEMRTFSLHSIAFVFVLQECVFLVFFLGVRLISQIANCGLLFQ